MTCAGAHELTLDVAAGERVALSGRDGATATALLRAVAGLNPVGGGQITVGGRGSRTPAERALARQGLRLAPPAPRPGPFAGAGGRRTGPQRTPGSRGVRR